MTSGQQGVLVGHQAAAGPPILRRGPVKVISPLEQARCLFALGSAMRFGYVLLKSHRRLDHGFKMIQLESDCQRAMTRRERARIPLQVLVRRCIGLILRQSSGRLEHTSNLSTIPAVTGRNLPKLVGGIFEDLFAIELDSGFPSFRSLQVPLPDLERLILVEVRIVGVHLHPGLHRFVKGPDAVGGQDQDAGVILQHA